MTVFKTSLHTFAHTVFKTASYTLCPYYFQYSFLCFSPFFAILKRKIWATEDILSLWQGKKNGQYRTNVV